MTQGELLAAAIVAEIARLKTLGTPSLLALATEGTTIDVEISGHRYSIEVWAEPVSHDADGLCVVLVRIRQRHLIGHTHHLRGFLLTANGEKVDLDEEDLWAYD